MDNKTLISYKVQAIYSLNGKDTYNFGRSYKDLKKAKAKYFKIINEPCKFLEEKYKKVQLMEVTFTTITAENLIFDID